MNAMELREFAQEALARAHAEYNLATRLNWLKFASELTTLAREQPAWTPDEETWWRPEEWRASTRQ